MYALPVCTSHPSLPATTSHQQAHTPKQCRSSPRREAGTSLWRIRWSHCERESQHQASYDDGCTQEPKYNFN